MRYEYDDGGRKAAGYKGDAEDCVVRAIAIATEQPYAAVYQVLFDLNRQNNRDGRCSPRNRGTKKKTVREYLEALGWRWTPTMQIGSGCKVHLRCGELPTGRLIVSVSKHLCAVINGVIRDTHDPSRNGTRCVYGYFQEEGT